jgi:hypothetical protein
MIDHLSNTLAAMSFKHLNEALKRLLDDTEDSDVAQTANLSSPVQPLLGNAAEPSETPKSDFISNTTPFHNQSAFIKSIQLVAALSESLSPASGQCHIPFLPKSRSTFSTISELSFIQNQISAQVHWH